VTATLPTAREPRPYRVVDRYQRGWVTAVDPCRTYPQLPEVWTFAGLEADRAPLRPVVAMPGEDRQVLADVLAAAGRDAAATIMVALLKLSQRCYTADGSDARLIAGNPESWENRILPRFAWEVGSNLSNRRIDPRALGVIERVVGNWIFAKAVFVEVGGNLSSVMADVIGGVGEYELVADQWLRHGSLAEEIHRYMTLKL
jgi:hypothetical protein